MQARERVIVALDYPDAQSALALVDGLGESISFYKVGLQLFTAAGSECVRELKSRGKRVFLDLKFHDIPNTVAGAVRSVSTLGIDMLTVHASGGSAMMVAAVEAASLASPPPLVLAVTVLTSSDVAVLRATNVQVPPAEQVQQLAKLAREAGCGGIVCSPEEIEPVRDIVGTGMKIVVPGIRPAGSAKDDQARIATPGDALRRGADYLVIGRPITAAPDPKTAAERILREIAGR